MILDITHSYLREAHGIIVKIKDQSYLTVRPTGTSDKIIEL